MITKVAFVGHPTRDLARARRFYTEVLGLEVSAEHGDMGCEVDTPDGKTIALDPMTPKFKEDAGPYLALKVDDLAAEVERLRAAGANVVQGMWINKHDDGTEVCRMAIIADPDGNPIMLHQIAASRQAWRLRFLAAEGPAVRGGPRAPRRWSAGRSGARGACPPRRSGATARTRCSSAAPCR